MELEHLKIKTRLTNEKFASVKVSVTGQSGTVQVQVQVFLQQIKKKVEAEGKNCHTKTMLSLEKPIKLI